MREATRLVDRAPSTPSAPVIVAAIGVWFYLGTAATGQGLTAATTFDGDYIGGTTLTHAGATCDPVGVTAEMTIARSQATIRTIQSNGQSGIAFSGAIDRSGSMQAVGRRLIVGSGMGGDLRLAAAIEGGEVTGDIAGGGCRWDFNMEKNSCRGRLAHVARAVAQFIERDRRGI